LGIKVLEETLESEAITSLGHFDAITLWDVIEHSTDPLVAVRRAYQLLAKGGILVLRTPNMNFHHMRIRFFPWIGRREGRNIYLDAPLHLFGFSPSNIRMLLHKVGFDEIEIMTGEPRQAGGKPSRFARSVLYYFAKVLSFLTFGKLILSSSMLVIARKWG